MKRLSAILVLLLFWLTACQAIQPPPAATAPPTPAAVPATATPLPTPSPADEAAAEALQNLLDAQVLQQNILGMAMAARLGDGWVIFRESGPLHREGVEPWTFDTRSALGSVTKTYTAVVVMQLVEQGKLSLDDTLDRWFPGQPNGDRITVRMLLSHTSGMNNAILPGNERDPKWAQPWTPQALVDEANRNGPVAEPGSAVAHYSNAGYHLLGLIVEAVTGRSWEREVQARIIDPLDLDHTTFLDVPGVWGGSLVEGYTRTPDGYVSMLEIPDMVHPSTAYAAGAVVSSLADLITFASALFDGKLVSPESLALMATPVAPDEGSPRLWGLGGATLAEMPGVFGMGGDTPGYHAFFVGKIGTPYVVAAFVNTEEGDVVGPGLTALQYLLSQQAPGDAPAADEAASPAEMPASSPAAALQGLVDGQVKEQNILGMAMAVRLPDGSVLGAASGTSDAAGTLPWTIDTQSAFGSITKTFTAVLILQLMEQGKLSLEDTIDRWFPGQPEGDRITVRMLLSHTSGLANYISADNVFDPKWAQPWSPADLVAEANALGPVDIPGASVGHYSNTGYILLGLIVEAETGGAWEQAVQTRLLDPLEMAHTRFLAAPGVWGGSLAEGYSRRDGSFLSVLDLPSYPDASTVWAAGGLVGTARDLMTFASALFDGKLLSPDTLALMAMPVAADDSSPRLWGLGGATLAEMPAAFGMGGDIPGYHAFFVGVMGTPYVVVALTNTEEGDVLTPSFAALQYLMEQAGG